MAGFGATSGAMWAGVLANCGDESAATDRKTAPPTNAESPFRISSRNRKREWHTRHGVSPCHRPGGVACEWHVLLIVGDELHYIRSLALEGAMGVITTGSPRCLDVPQPDPPGKSRSFRWPPKWTVVSRTFATASPWTDRTPFTETRPSDGSGGLHTSLTGGRPR